MRQIICDVLVIGGGAAGSRAAYEAKKRHPELQVFLMVAGHYGSSGSSNLMASESLGINAPFNYMGDGDNSSIYYEDTVSTGGYLADEKLCGIIAGESCRRLEELMELGARFDVQDGHPVQRLLSGCTKARSLTYGGATGQEIVRVLKKANEVMGVEVFEDIRVVDLIKDENGRVCGAVGFCGAENILVRAGAVILATGGAGRIFRKNVNPPSLDGDGWAMAYKAGAKLVNMEFFQIGPAVMLPKIQFIVHSHMWRLKPVLFNTEDREFLPDYCPDNLLSDTVLDAKAMSYPFSVRTEAMYLDIAIFKEIMAGRCTLDDGVFFDVTHVSREDFLRKAPITYEILKNAGADLAKDKIEVGLVVQNFNGGILIDEHGFTGVDGLYAAGEVTGGVHGSDRPGGNNLTDTQVFGYRAGRSAADSAASLKSKVFMCFETSEIVQGLQDSENEKDIIRQSEDLFYRELTIVRHAEGLKRVLDFIKEHKKESNSLFLNNRLLVGQILATAILTREESRGTHYREDYPQTDISWQKRILISQGKNGEPFIELKN